MQMIKYFFKNLDVMWLSSEYVGVVWKVATCVTAIKGLKCCLEEAST